VCWRGALSCCGDAWDRRPHIRQLLDSRSTDCGVSAVRLLSVSGGATFRFGMNRGRQDRPPNWAEDHEISQPDPFGVAPVRRRLLPFLLLPHHKCCHRGRAFLKHAVARVRPRLAYRRLLPLLCGHAIAGRSCPGSLRAAAMTGRASVCLVSLRIDPNATRMSFAFGEKLTASGISIWIKIQRTKGRTDDNAELQSARLR
jgi:hypothetical protein